MEDNPFDLDACLARIRHTGGRQPTLSTLRAIVLAHAVAIPYENVDVLLGRPISLNLAALTRKMISGGRGGYCFEHNLLLRAGLHALGFDVSGRMGWVVRGMDPQAVRTAPHMALWIELPEGAFIADTGFGSLTLTNPLAAIAGETQTTPHGDFRVSFQGSDPTVEVRIGGAWESLYRLIPRVSLNADHEVANWFTATHPGSLFVNNLIAARPCIDGTRVTLFNGRMNVRRPGHGVERHHLQGIEETARALTDRFCLPLSPEDVAACLEMLDRNGTLGVGHPIF